MAAAAAAANQRNHFSHTHPLSLHHVPPSSSDLHCSACEARAAAGSLVYACWSCNYFLHDRCFTAPRSLVHPSHPLHPLSLLPYPTYPSATFFCNTCGLAGKSFCYCCSECDVDLHLHCAQNPNSVLPAYQSNNNNNNSVYPPPPPPPVHHANIVNVGGVYPPTTTPL